MATQLIRRKTYSAGWLTFGYFIIRHLAVFIEAALRGYVSEGMQVADIGCGEQPWRQLIEQLGGQYTGIDLQQNASNSVDILADLNSRIKIPDNSVDVVLLSEVLEHLTAAENALGEINRVLKPGGVVIVTTPFVYRIHEAPYDFSRYTNYYFESNAGRLHFTVVDSRRSGDTLEVMATIWDDLWCLERGRPFRLPRRLWNAGMRAIGHAFVRIVSATGVKVPEFYYLSTMCVLRKI